jgi:hypothetical protein
MKRSIQRIIFVIVVIGIIAAIAGYFLYTKPQADLSKLHADITIMASNLYQDYSTDEKVSDSIYLNKIIEVTGPVAEYNVNADSSISISIHSPEVDFGVNCNILKPLKPEVVKIEKGKTVVIRGICSGFNGFEVALNNCAIVSR